MSSPHRVGYRPTWWAGDETEALDTSSRPGRHRGRPVPVRHDCPIPVVKSNVGEPTASFHRGGAGWAGGGPDGAGVTRTESGVGRREAPGAGERFTGNGDPRRVSRGL